MPVSVTNIGTNTGASGATLAVTVGAAGVPAGCLIVVVVTEKSTSGTSGTLADTPTNSYSTAIAGNLNNAAASGRGTVFYAWNAKALVQNDTITYTRNLSAAQCAITACYAIGVRNDADPRDTAVNATATGSTGTITVTSGTPGEANELFFGILCASGTSTTGGNATFTQAGAPWTSPPNQATTGGSGGARSVGAWQRNTGTGTKVYNPTLSSTAQVWADFIVGFKTIPDNYYSSNRYFDWVPQRNYRYYQIDENYNFFRDIPIVPQYQPIAIEWQPPPPVTWYRDWGQSPKPVAVVQNPFKQSDWPIRGIPPWYRATEQNLLELPFFKPIPYLQQDWPYPQRVIWYRDAYATLLPELYYYTVPQFQKDWPAPPRVNWYKSLEQNLLETPFFTPIPYLETNWPNPTRVTWYRDWSQGPQPQPVVVVGTPFNQDDWPLPIRSPWYRDWSYTPFPQIGVFPFNPTDWPNPKGIVWYRDWSQSPQVPQTTPFNQKDWPLPARLTWYRDWALGPYIPVVIPFRQQDWPLTERPKEFRAWIQNLLETTLTPVVTQAPFNQTNWQLPYPVYWFKDQNSNLVLLFGPTPPTPTDELHFKPLHITMGRLGNLGGLS